MGRSGTSLLSLILQAKGVWFGQKSELVNETPINVYGHVEHIKIKQIQKDLLREVFSINTWLFLGDLNPNWHRHPLIYPYKEKLKVELRKLSANWTTSYGFKDPRSTMLLPMWKDIFEEEEINAQYIFCTRDSKNVYKSLIHVGKVSDFPSNQDVPFENIEKICYQYKDEAEKVDHIKIRFNDWFTGQKDIQDAILSEYLDLPKKFGMSYIDDKERHF